MIYSPSPEYPAAYRRDDQPSPKASARQDGEENRAVARRVSVLHTCLLQSMERQVGYGAIPLDTTPHVEDPGLSGRWGASFLTAMIPTRQ